MQDPFSDVFAQDAQNLRVGQVVSFELVPSRDGGLAAVNIMVDDQCLEATTTPSSIIGSAATQNGKHVELSQNEAKRRIDRRQGPVVNVARNEAPHIVMRQRIYPPRRRHPAEKVLKPRGQAAVAAATTA